jgi:hypothetical protein
MRFARLAALVALALVLLATPLVTEAQPATKIYRVAWLTPAPARWKKEPTTPARAGNWQTLGFLLVTRERPASHAASGEVSD